MDEMKIVSKFMTGIISKLLKVTIHKKTGYQVDIQLNECTVAFDYDKAHVHLSVDADMSKEELLKILKSAGLD